MPAYTMPGLMTGQNTNDIIQKLVELEKKPAKRWETDNEFSKIQVQAWNELKNQTNSLQNKTRALTSFTAPFSTKSVKASEEGVLSGEASRGAKSGEKQLEILELATKHQISGNPVDTKVVLPSGSLTIHLGKSSETIQFAGGSLNELFTAIRNSAGSSVLPALVKIDRESSVLTLVGQKTGKSQRILFEDPEGILQEAGLVRKRVSTESQERTPVLLSSDNLEPYLDKKYKSTAKETPPQKTEHGWEISPDTAFSFGIPAVEVTQRTELIFEFENANLPNLEVGVRFEKDGAARTRMQSLSLEGGKGKLSLGDFAQGKSLTKVILTNPGLEPFRLSALTLEVSPEPGDSEPILVLQEPKDARIRIDGVEIARESNESITDVLEGISFTIHKTTKEPVSLKIQTDSQKGTQLIKEWVESYNLLMKTSKEFTSVERDGKISDRKLIDNNKNEDISREYWDNKSKAGLLAGDNAVLRLIAGMKTVANSYYPSKGYKVLSDIGISTGAVGSNWTKIQDGLLVIDEETLKNALAENPDGVRELFATDSNGDGRMEDGVGSKLLDHLKPYTQFPVGIIAGKIKFLEDSISQNNKRIKDHESHLAGYEAKLKQRFLYMEQGVGKNKSVGTYLQNNLFRNSQQE